MHFSIDESTTSQIGSLYLVKLYPEYTLITSNILKICGHV